MIHERGKKQIIRYLKGTAEKGIELSPNPTEGVKCFVDADFAGGYCNKTRDELISVYGSRTGYIIFYLGYPVLWVSKLQADITLLTVEAEYALL